MLHPVFFSLLSKKGLGVNPYVKNNGTEKLVLCVHVNLQVLDKNDFSPHPWDVWTPDFCPPWTPPHRMFPPL